MNDAPKQFNVTPPSKKSRGRPVTCEIKLDASSEQVVHAIFAAVRKPDPSIRIPKTGTRKSKDKED